MELGDGRWRGTHRQGEARSARHLPHPVTALTTGTCHAPPPQRSFGVVLWELLTWRAPWQGVQPFKVAAAVRRGERLEVPALEALPGPPPPSWEAYQAYVALMRDCWAHEEAARPDLDAAVRRLSELLAASAAGGSM